MNDSYQRNIPLAVFGLNHRTAGVEIREKASLGDEECKSLIQQFTAKYEACGIMILSTCNRTELYIGGKEASSQLSLLCEQVDEFIKQKIFCNEDVTYIYYDKQAVHHFFRVISGLDSQMIGETQITGQVKDAYEKALALNSTDLFINKMYHFGMQAEKQVRSNTYLTDGAASVSFAGVELARKIFNHLQKNIILLIGAGETAELAAMHFLKRDVSKILVVNRTYAKAETLAKKFSGEAVPIEDLNTALYRSDIVISATSSKDYVVGIEMLKDVTKKRDHKPIFLIDLAIPRDIDPASRKLDGVYLYDLDSLQDIVDNNIKKRKAEIPKAEKIIQHHVDAYMQWYKDLPVTDTITKLSSFFEEIREKEYQRLKKRFPEENQAEVEYLTKSLMKKFLHQHIKTLRENNNNQHRRKQYIDLMSEIYLKNGSENKGEENS